MNTENDDYEVSLRKLKKEINKKKFSGKDIYCVTCGYSGSPKKTHQGSFVIELILWILFIIPGLAYSIWRQTSKISSCPVCKGTSVIPALSPIAQRAMIDLE